ncbi:hypothetical protein J8J27_28720, partial [Mycobacterium tuberculosis]|nr:hypothetical protein [Mycobacterium tuberculosis]
LLAPKIDATTSPERLLRMRIAPLLVPLIVWSIVFLATDLLSSAQAGGAGVVVSLRKSFSSAYWFLWALLVGADIVWLWAQFGRRHRGSA